MFPDGGTRQTSNDVNSLLPLLMCNGGFGGGNWIWIIFLFFLYPLMRNGGLFGNIGSNGNCLCPLANMVNNNDGRDLIMQAINGNGAAVQRLATMFGTKVDMIQSAICQVNNSVAQVGCKIDSSTGALLNAGTQNTMTLANQLATCCCDLKNAITEGNYQNQISTIQQTDTIKQSVGDVGNAVTRGFSDVGYALRDQTCNMNKSELKEKIRRMKMEIQELEECLDKYEERDNRYDDDPQYRNRNPYDDEERYHEREEYGHRERGRYGRY